MSNRLPWFLLLSFLVLLLGCGHVISKNLRAEADPSLTFKQVFQNPNEYKGKIVLWGGEIIQAVNEKDGTTLIEVFQRPLSSSLKRTNLSLGGVLLPSIFLLLL